MEKVLFLTNVIRRLAMMQETLGTLSGTPGAMAHPGECRWITESTEWNAEWVRTLEDSGLVLVKWMGTGLDTPFLNKLLDALQRRGLPYYIDAAGSDRPELAQGLSDAQVRDIRQYFVHGGRDNYTLLWRYADAFLDGQGDTVPKARPLVWYGIYHPDEAEPFATLEAYEKKHLRAGRPTLAILFYRDEWVWKDLAYQTALIREIEGRGLNAVCVFTNGMPSEEAGMPSLREVFRRCFFQDGVPAVDVVLNTMKFSLTSSGSLTIDFLKCQGIPVLAAYTVMTPYEEWKDSFEGMNAMEVSISVSLPEFDGTVHGVPVAYRHQLENGDIRYLPIPERVTRMVAKAEKWARLRHKENKDKKIVILFHNYPPKNSNIGSAVALDTMESVRRLLAAMRDRGYKVDFVPRDTKEFISLLTACATNDRSLLTDDQIARAPKVSAKEYGALYETLEPSVQVQMEKDWGPAPGTVMACDGGLLVPGIEDGNIFITVQPPRGFGEDPEKIYHDPFVAPTHHYLAFYRWLRDGWKADAVAHIGTHGSLEWLPGKNAGLGPTCYPDIALDDLPDVYPYLISITGEGIQAKRRGSACLIEHLPAPQMQAGLYDELAELEKVMDEYVHFARTQPENLAALENMVREKVAQANLANEVPYEEGQPFGEYVAALHHYLTDLKDMQVHTGLHILGQAPEGEELRETLLLLTRLANGTVPSLLELLAGTYGLAYHTLTEQSTVWYEPLQLSYGMLLDRIQDQAREIIATLAGGGFTDQAVEEVLMDDSIRREPQSFRDGLRQVCAYLCHTVAPNLAKTTQEMANLLDAWDGRYIEPGPSGSPSSGGADLLPTGRNFYGIDHRALPTPAAWKLGMALGDQAVERFIAEEGRYPESVGIVLWSGANMRSHGQCIAEFLYLMGIRPVWQSGSMRVCGLEAIPLSELKRPRIDVTGRISGLFRDTMPAPVAWLDKAVLLAAGLDEDDEQNYVRKHVRADSAGLEREGMAQPEAWRQAAFRIFGDAQGTYGAGVAALLEAKNWESIDDLADVYVRWGGHAYGGKTKGAFLPQLFRKRMASLDLTIKNEDNHETNLLSSDDYNAYHGGMIAAVRSIRGKAPRSYCGDSTDRSRVALHSVQEQTKRIFRSEAINPKFLEGMKKHGYKGAADLANYVAHSFQWDATSAVMEDWMYEAYAQKYALDRDMQAWMKDVNPWALQRIAATLLEAQQRQLWHADAETLDALRKLYLDMEGDLEERADCRG